MSMLAGARRKQKISVNPNGLQFSKDETGIGQKLLSQMGWEKGKGLGANEQGDKDPIKVKQNIESRGLGCKRADADKWIAHQDDFNSLLANLNENTEGEEEGKQAENSSSGVQSLEAKSKSSRSRVHYMKFTKGKDLSRHSDKDLACILGPSRSENCTPTPSSKAGLGDDSDAGEDADNTAADDSDPFLSDAMHVTSTLSLQEYFASKMAAKRNTSSNSMLTDLAVSTPDPASPHTPDTAEEVTIGVGKATFFIGDESEATTVTSKHKKKKSKRHELAIEQEEMEPVRKKKKKKKRKELEEEAGHSTSGKTKPKPADDTMKFVSESSEDEDRDQCTDKDTHVEESLKRGQKRHHSPDVGHDQRHSFKKSGKLRKSKSDSQLLTEHKHNTQDSTDCYSHTKKRSKKDKYKDSV